MISDFHMDGTGRTSREHEPYINTVILLLVVQLKAACLGRIARNIHFVGDSIRDTGDVMFAAVFSEFKGVFLVGFR